MDRLAGTGRTRFQARPVLPTTLSEVITARLDRVGADAKRTAQAASVIGRTFDRPALVAASGLDEPELDVHLERLSEHAVIEATGRTNELRFRHALFYEASYRDFNSTLAG